MELTFTKNTISFGVEENVLFGDSILTLKKGIMSEGSRLPSSSGLISYDLRPGELLQGEGKLIFTVPSLDTPICESQIKKLSIRLTEVEKAWNKDIYVLSMDTPFAQARFIKEHQINPAIKFVSDYSDREFLDNSGLKINELNLFTRAVIECNAQNIVTKIIVSKDITHVPFL